MHPKPLVRRTHSPEFKARVLAACRQPGASIAAVALAHGINANVVHKWLAGIGLKRAGLHLPAAVRSTPSPATPMQFVPVGLVSLTAVMEPPMFGVMEPQTGS
jgi:transposase-like protein